jgi:hypothetical protein
VLERQHVRVDEVGDPVCGEVGAQIERGVSLVAHSTNEKPTKRPVARSLGRRREPLEAPPPQVREPPSGTSFGWYLGHAAGGCREWPISLLRLGVGAAPRLFRTAAWPAGEAKIGGRSDPGRNPEANPVMAMNRTRLQELAKQEGIRDDAYSLDGGLPSERYVLEITEGGWHVLLLGAGASYGH